MSAEDLAEEPLTFEAVAAAQAARTAGLSAAQRETILSELLEVAVASGALRRVREERQRAVDVAWSTPTRG